MNPNRQLAEALKTTAEIYGKQMSDAAAAMFIADLGRFTPEQILKSLARCRLELRTFPTIADIAARIDDGRPGPEEAWAMIPKDEYSSVVWTDEMRDAFAACRSLLEEDFVAARMAFREKYSQLLAEARSLGRQARWTPSLGHDRHGREQALQRAVQRDLMASDHAQSLLPDLSVQTPASIAMIEGPDVDPVAIQQFLSNMRLLLKDMPNGAPKREWSEPTQSELDRRRQLLREQARMIEADPQKATAKGERKTHEPEEISL